MFAQPVSASFRRRTSLLYVSTTKSRSTTTIPMTIHSQSTTTVILGGVEAVVMAAGQGTRLRPLTERYAKPVLPIDGRPVIVTLLHELAFVERVMVVVGHLGAPGAGAAGRVSGRAPVRRAAGGARLRRRGREGRATPPYLVLAADTVFRPGDVGGSRGSRRTARSPCGGRRRPDPVHRHGVGVKDGRVVRFHDESSEWSGAPLWLVGPWIHERVLERPGSPPWELGTAFQLAVDAGLDVRAVEIGPTRDLDASRRSRRQQLPVHARGVHGVASESVATVEMLEAIADAFNQHDADAVMSFFTDDCVFETPRGPEPCGRRLVGKDAVREGVAARFAGIPDVHYGDGTHWVLGDRGVSEWTLTGTTTDGAASRAAGLRSLDLPRRKGAEEGLVLEAGRAELDAFA